jgi:hypothetical protein
MESIEDGKTSPLALNYKLLWFLLLSKQNICHTMEKVHQAFTGLHENQGFMFFFRNFLLTLTVEPFLTPASTSQFSGL